MGLWIELGNFLVRVVCPDCKRGLDIEVEADSTSDAKWKVMGDIVTDPLDHRFKVTGETLIGVSEILSPEEAEKRSRRVYETLRSESRKIGVPPVVELEERPLYPLVVKDYDRKRISVRVGEKDEGYFAGRWLIREKTPYFDGYLIRLQREFIIKGHDRRTEEHVTDTQILGWEYLISGLEWEAYEKLIKLVRPTLRNQVYSLMITTFIPKTIMTVATALNLTRDQVRSKFDDLVKEGKLIRSKTYPTTVLGEAKYEMLKPVKSEFFVAELKGLPLPPEAYLTFPPKPEEEVISLSRYVR